MAYIVQADVEYRFTAALVVDVYDDIVDGVADASPLAADISDAENYVEEAIRKTYGEAGLTALRALGTACPRSIKRRCLDAMRIIIAERHPDFIRLDADVAWERFFRDLDRLKLREVELAEVAGTIEGSTGAMNEGGVVRSGDPDATTPVAKVFMDGTGVF